MQKPHEVLELRFDSATTKVITDVRDQVLTNIGMSHERHGLFTPHLSLASSPSDSFTLAFDQIESLCARYKNLPLKLSHIGAFKGASHTLFLGITPTAELLDLHRELHSLLEQHRIQQVDFIRPNAFVPHCTLATNITNEHLLQGMRLLEGLSLPLLATAESLSLVEYFPEKVVSSCTLAE